MDESLKFSFGILLLFSLLDNQQLKQYQITHLMLLLEKMQQHYHKVNQIDILLRRKHNLYIKNH